MSVYFVDYLYTFFMCWHGFCQYKTYPLVYLCLLALYVLLCFSVVVFYRKIDRSYIRFSYCFLTRVICHFSSLLPQFILPHRCSAFSSSFAHVTTPITILSVFRPELFNDSLLDYQFTPFLAIFHCCGLICYATIFCKFTFEFY